MDHATFSDSWLYVKRIRVVSITSANVTLTSAAKTDHCTTYVGFFNFMLPTPGWTTLRNVLIASTYQPCADDTPLVYATGKGTLEIVNCTFLGRTKHIYAFLDTYVEVSGSCRFENGSPAILPQRINYIALTGSNITFEGGSTAIQSTSSPVILAGNVSFINHRGYEGGAMSLIDSRVTIHDNAHIVFQNNYASHVGGAIYSSDNDITTYVSSSVTPDLHRLALGDNITLEFINNTAESGGSAVYGITVSNTVYPSTSYSRLISYNNLFSMLSFEPDDVSSVSSDPLRVCICPDERLLDCLAILPGQNIQHLHYTIYPGQNFIIPAAAVGFNFSPTSGSVYAQFLNSHATLGSKSQYVQGVNQTGCSPLEYSVLSDNMQETLVLKVNSRRIDGIPTGLDSDIHAIKYDNIFPSGSDKSYTNPTRYFKNGTFVTNMTDGIFRLAGYVPRSLQTTPVFISLTLLDCPPGFTLSNDHRCECNEQILQHSLTCNINNQTVHRNGSIWINATVGVNSHIGVIVHQHCPFGYCKQEPVDVDLTNPDSQCAFDHAYTLCGACKPNFSLALGSSQCLPKCSNSFLSLLVAFALAGFALVSFIKILNLTVSEGSINGLIFYTNIVAANRSILFPESYNKFLSFLSVFISWLNLDLGIETCFFKGLDGYWKTWLQFVFPFYVWAIAGVIILISHHSMRATKIFGKNSLSVLATLFLLSYGKLLRSIITIFSFTTLQYPDNSTSVVWAFDGNISYLSSKHIPLFVFALVIFLLLWLPYTVVLLSAQWLRTQTHHKGFGWLKPFLDAYYGPFKDKHHYWVGVLLAVRGVLFVLFAYFSSVENNVNLLLTSIASIFAAVCLSVTGRLYKKIHLSALENSFFFNLGVLAAGTLYIEHVGGNQEVLATISICIAFLQFVMTACFHTYYFVLVPIKNKCKDFAKSRAEQHAHHDELQPILNFDSSDSDFEDEDRPKPVVTYSEVCLAVLRKEEENTLSQHDTNVDDNGALRRSSNKESGNQQLAPGEATQDHFTINTGERPHTHQDSNELEQPEHAKAREQDIANHVKINYNVSETFTEFNDDSSHPISFSLETPKERNKPVWNSTVEDDSLNAQDEPALKGESLNAQGEPELKTNDYPRFFAAERDDRFIDFHAPRETLLEYTQYHLPEEKAVPARDSTTERDITLPSRRRELSQQEDPPSRYAGREHLFDFSAPREPLLEFLT